MSEDWQVAEATRETQLWASRWHDGQSSGLYSLSSTGVFWASKMESIYAEYQTILDLDYGQVPAGVLDDIEDAYNLYYVRSCWGETS